MTPRERKLMIFLAVFGSVAVLAGGYMFLVSPWLTARADAKKLQDELDTEDSKLRDLEVKLPKYVAYKSRSLPDDSTATKAVARREYFSMLNALLRSTGVPSGFTLGERESSGDAKNIPNLGAKQPAYTRIAYEISMKKVDLPTITRFLEAYYRQPVLQQITKLDIKKSATAEKSAKDADLDVTILTEAIVLDGAEKRPSLYPISPAQGGMVGSLGLALLHEYPQVAAKLVPGKPVPMLAPGRDYLSLAKRDPFHGPPTEVRKYPEVKKEVVKEDPKPAVTPVPLEDISPFIRLTGITWRSDGTATAEIRDSANNYEYEVARKSSLDGTLTISVKKWYFINAARKPMDSFEDLVIIEEGTSTDRKFKVLDFQHEGLLLSETVVPKEEAPAAASPEKGPVGKGSTGKSSSKKSTALTKPQLNAALVGGFASIPPKPLTRIYLWKIGTTLKQLEEVKPAKPVEESPMPMPIPPGR